MFPYEIVPRRAGKDDYDFPEIDCYVRNMD